MRSTFHADLRAVLDDLVVMTRMAGTAIERATRSLVEADVTLADSVIAADVELDALREDVDARSIDLLARQAPVATDLRTIVTSMRMSADLERMGDLAEHDVAFRLRRLEAQIETQEAIVEAVLTLSTIDEPSLVPAGQITPSA